MDSAIINTTTETKTLQATTDDTLVPTETLLETMHEITTTTNSLQAMKIDSSSSAEVLQTAMVGEMMQTSSLQTTTTGVIIPEKTLKDSQSDSMTKKTFKATMAPMEKPIANLTDTGIRNDNPKAKESSTNIPKEVLKNTVITGMRSTSDMSKVYEIRETKNKGLAMFATTKIPRGSLVLAEAPILRIAHGDYTPLIVRKEFERLSAAAKEDFMSLHSVHNLIIPHPSEKYADKLDGVKKDAVYGAWFARTAKKKSVYSVFLGNSMCSDKGAAVFRDASRINHSCVPNCNFFWRADEGREHIRAMKDLQAGEEITICYIDPLLDLNTRIWSLRRTYGFDCECKACANAGDPFSFAAKSRDRRWRLRELDDRMVYFEEDELQEFNDKLEMVILMNEEEMCLPKIAESYLRISHICKRKGDLPTALKAAAQAFDNFAVCLGADSTSSVVSAKWLAKLELEVAKLEKPKDDTL